MIVETVERPSKASSMARRGKSKVLCFLLVAVVLTIICGAYYRNVENMYQPFSKGVTQERMKGQPSDDLQNKYEEVKHFLFDTSDKFKTMDANLAMDDEDDEFLYHSPVPTSQVPLTGESSDIADDDIASSQDLPDSIESSNLDENKDSQSERDVEVDSYDNRLDEEDQKSESVSDDLERDENDSEELNFETDSYKPDDEAGGEGSRSSEETENYTGLKSEDLLPEETVNDRVFLENFNENADDTKSSGDDRKSYDGLPLVFDENMSQGTETYDLEPGKNEDVLLEGFDQYIPQEVENFNKGVDEQSIQNSYSVHESEMTSSADQSDSQSETVLRAGNDESTLLFDENMQKTKNDNLEKLKSENTAESLGDLLQELAKNTDKVTDHSEKEYSDGSEVDNLEISETESNKVQDQTVDSNVDISASQDEASDEFNVNLPPESEDLGGSSEVLEDSGGSSDVIEEADSEAVEESGSNDESESLSEDTGNDEFVDSLSSVAEEVPESLSSESSSVFINDLQEWLDMPGSESTSDSENSVSESEIRFSEEGDKSVNDETSNAINEEENVIENEKFTSVSENIPASNDRETPPEIPFDEETALSEQPSLTVGYQTPDLSPEQNVSVQFENLQFQPPEEPALAEGQAPELYQQPVQSVLENSSQIQVNVEVPPEEQLPQFQPPEGPALAEGQAPELYQQPVQSVLESGSQIQVNVEVPPEEQLPPEPEELVQNVNIDEATIEHGVEETPELGVGEAEPINPQEVVTDGRLKVLILTSPHFHPWLLDEIFGQNEKFFYVVEPGVALRQCLELLSPAESVFSTRLADMLFDILRCDFRSPNLECFTDNYSQLGVSQRQAQMRSLVNDRFCWRADGSPTSDFAGCKEVDGGMISEECKAATYVGVRTNYMHDIKYVVLLMKDPRVKVIHLVQDPRAVALSLLESQHGIKDRYDMLDLDLKTQTAITEYCRTWVHNIVSMHTLSDTYKSRYKIVRFEDVESNHQTYPSRLYQFLDIQMEEAMLALTRNGTRGTKFDNWKYKLTFDALQIIQYIVPCIDMMQAVGYKTIDTHPELMNQAEQMTNTQLASSQRAAAPPQPNEQLPMRTAR